MSKRYDTRLRDHVKATVTMERCLEIIGWEAPNRSKKIHSIYTSDSTPSLHIYKDNYHCYATGQSGDVIKFAMDALQVDYHSALKILSGGIQFSPRRMERKKQQELKDLGKIFNSQPVPDMKAEAQARELIATKWPTLTLENLLSYGVKLTPTSLWAPHTDSKGIIRGIKIRSIPSGSKYSVDGSNYSSRLYRVKETHPSSETLLICEGESDLWCLQKWIDDQGYSSTMSVLSLPSGAAMWRDNWTEEVENWGHVVMLLDNDDAGNKAMDKIQDNLGSSLVERPDIPEGRVAESMATGWNPLC